MTHIEQLFSDLNKRGLIKQLTDPRLEQTLTETPITVYAGFDPSADSLHIGHLLPLLILKRFQEHGHKVIAVIGGATGMIGDPSFKAEERTLLTKEQIEKNLLGIKSVIARFLNLDGNNQALILNNADWIQNYSYLEFLRDIGKHFTINHMIAKESVRARLEDRGISYTEFSYMLLQAYDFYYLYKNYNCILQIGGSDQWGNITEGIELIRRLSDDQPKEQPVFGFTIPLLMKKDGSKFGKTESGAVWLDKEKTPVYDFYQFWMQSEDTQVIDLLKFFTFLSIEKIQELENSLKAEPGKREAQKTLANTLTEMTHGKTELERVKTASVTLFSMDIKNLDPKALIEMFKGAPTLTKSKATLDDGVSLIDLVVETKLLSSKGAARKEIQAGGIYVNNERISDIGTKLAISNLIADEFLILRRGKKNYFLIRFC